MKNLDEVQRQPATIADVADAIALTLRMLEGASFSRDVWLRRIAISLSAMRPFGQEAERSEALFERMKESFIPRTIRCAASVRKSQRRRHEHSRAMAQRLR